MQTRAFSVENDAKRQAILHGERFRGRLMRKERWQTVLLHGALQQRCGLCSGATIQKVDGLRLPKKVDGL